ncbi:MAG: DnaD domain protein, partial [Candidatus Fimimonas sp.]
PEALVAVAKYCVALKGKDINYRYILTVARNQLAKGATTLEVVQDNLNSQQKYDEDLKLVFKALGLTRKFDHQDREMYEKWTKDFGFTQDVVIAVAKNCNRKSMDKLDATLVEYYKKSALSLAEIEHYQTEKQHYTQLAISVNRALGLYYQSVDAIVDEYVVGWVSKGYDDETLLAIAKYAFRSGVRTLAGFAKVIDKLYKNGITTLVALDGYLQSIAAQDELIKEVLQNAGLERNVTNNDRALYRTWTALWNMPQEVICFVAQKSAGSVSPTAYVNKVLSAYKQKGIFSLAQAQAEKQSTATEAPVKRAVIGKDLERRVYTDEQLNSLFTALDETED